MSLQKKKTIQINPNDDLNNITNNNDSDEELINDNDFDDLLNNFSNQNNINNNTKLSKKDISESILGINPDNFINDILKKGLLEETTNKTDNKNNNINDIVDSITKEVENSNINTTADKSDIKLKISNII